MWRPAGWTGRMFNEQAIEIMTPTERGACQTEYEAGADAMLEALIKQPSDRGANVLYVDELADGSTILHNPHRRGWLVFIPEDKEE